MNWFLVSVGSAASFSRSCEAKVGRGQRQSFSLSGETSGSSKAHSLGRSGTRTSALGAFQRRSRCMSKKTMSHEDPTRPDWEVKVYVQALFGFRGQMDCDLKFRKGEKIELLTRTSKQFDWWEGKTADGRLGIFPANYVKII